MTNQPAPHGNPPASTGNASNPSADTGVQPEKTQLIDEKGEKYLREVAPVQDYPDATDEERSDDSAHK